MKGSGIYRTSGGGLNKPLMELVTAAKEKGAGLYRTGGKVRRTRRVGKGVLDDELTTDLHLKR